MSFYDFFLRPPVGRPTTGSSLENPHKIIFYYEDNWSRKSGKCKSSPGKLANTVLIAESGEMLCLGGLHHVSKSM